MTISRRNMLAATGALSSSLLAPKLMASARGTGSIGDISALRNQLPGALVTPTDPSYHRDRIGKGFTPVADRFPSYIVLPESADDVAQALAFAQARNLDVSIRSGGNDILAASTTATGVLIDLVRMNGISFDRETGVATVGAGARAGALVTAVDGSGWSPVVGNNPHVGIGGLMLGGGMGWLAGKYGAAVDHLLSAQLVTADGSILEVSAENHPDLFWALRGGGGNFGVVTAFTIQMQRVSSVLGGVLSYRVDPAGFLRFYREFLAKSPDELDLAAVFSTGPMPSLFLKACWLGNQTEGWEILQPLRDFAVPDVDTIAPQAYAAFANDRQISSLNRLFWRGGEFDGLTDERIDLLAQVITGTDMKDCSIGVGHYMHGALCRTPFDSSPFIRTAGNLVYTVNAFWADSAGQAEMDRKREWAVASFQSLETQACDRTYINYLGHADKIGRAHV